MNTANRLSLQHIDLVVPYREASAERRDNLYGVLRHLVATYSDCRIWLMEADARPHFEWARIGDASVRHVFVHHDGPFPKARLCNMGVRLANSPVVCLHDADSVAMPTALTGAVNGLLHGATSDAICPYWPVVNVEGSLRQRFLETGDVGALHSLDPAALPPEAALLYASANGGVVLFKRQDYLRVGGYNERLEGWGGEDDELLNRATRLGVRWHSFTPPLIHLHHDTASRSEWIQATRDSDNIRHADAIQSMSDEALQALVTELSTQFGPVDRIAPPVEFSKPGD